MDAGTPSYPSRYIGNCPRQGDAPCIDPDSLARKTKLFGIENVLNWDNAADLTHAIPLQGRCPLSVSGATVQAAELLVADDLAAATKELETLTFRAHGDGTGTVQEVELYVEYKG